MKRLILICILIFCVFCCFATVITVDDDGLSYLLSFDSVSFSAPSAFCYGQDGFYIGEIRPAGLFRFIQSPSSSMFDFGSTKAFEKVYTPAINPAFTGFGKSFSWGDFAAFYPFGFYADIGNKNVYAGLLATKESSDTGKYLIDWSNITDGICFRSIAGYCDGFTMGPVSFKSAQYAHFLFKSTGTLAETGWNLSMSYEDLGISGYGRIGRVKSYGYTVSLSSLKISYSSDVYDKAVFGGTAQKKAVNLEFQFKWNNFTFKAVNSATADVDTGKTTGSEYELSYSSELFDSSLVVGLNRLEDLPMSVNKFRLNFNASNAIFGINGAKYSMSISAVERVELFDNSAEIHMSVNQDRLCSVSIRLLFDSPS